jgi:uncharacterized protein (DUF2141 family)
VKFLNSCAIVALAAGALSGAQAAQTSISASLRVTVDGITAAGGNLVIGVYDEATFPLNPDTPLFRQTLTNARGSATAVFNRLPPGTYAIKALQDVNRDGKGEAGEPAAVSNGAAPDNFDAASIVIQPGDNTTALHLH